MENEVFNKISQYRDLKESSAYPYLENEGDSERLILKKKENRAQMEDLKFEIISELGKNGVAIVKGNLVDALDILLKEIERSKTGFPLDRNQGLGINNYIYGKVAGVIRSAMKIGYGYYYPEFYQGVQSDFDASGLQELLISFKEELMITDFNGFFELEACVETYLSRIKQLWEKENEAMVIHRH
ncbi:hypothetical protein [Cyclobacterium plantarum]|uniref:hypothetical protein n=1 Tax=Cyclobacterium plantarum TaxID=2716263 RepID=UPI003F7306DE